VIGRTKSRTKKSGKAPGLLKRYKGTRGIPVDQRNSGTEFDDVSGKFRHVDNVSPRELVFQLGDASLIDFLLCFGRLIF
jgi:hypothetical protein